MNLISFIVIAFFGSSIMVSSAVSNIADGVQIQKVNDSNLKVETVYDGLEYPSSMTFIGSGDILVTEKDKGTIQRIVNGQKIDKPLLDVPVANENERGLLGIIFMKKEEGPSYVYLYFTESNNKTDGNDYCPKIISCEDGNDPKGNRLYRYEFDEDNKLKNPQLLLDLPATPGSDHVGGAPVIGPDDNIYLIVGDGSLSTSQTSNIGNGTHPDGRGGVLRIDPNRQLTDTHGILGDKGPSNIYYAYGIRNGFGLDFDPLTGKLWDTENGRDFGDEVNLVEPGFNSGWNKVQGIWTLGKNGTKGELVSEIPDNLVDFNGKGKYSPPEFTWNKTVGVTALKFLKSDKYGEKYKNDMFVGDIHNGNVYHFDLNKKRTGLILEGKLADKVADNEKEDSTLVFASGFHGITDIEVGPDGYLYLLSFHNTTRGDRHHYYGTGGIYRIVPVDNR